MSLEPIAIIGIGCRFPQADCPQAFWRLLQEGIDAVSEVPSSRWNIDAYYDPDPTKLDKTNARWGGFLEQIDGFDPQFFGIAPREVPSMDPQQRLILEVAWEALEDGGQIPAQLAGTSTGVFVGISTHEYSVLLWQKPINDPYGTTGTANSIAANRISYSLDLKGPSLAVDTACSSSLVAVHLACQSLWRGESCLALAGGVNVLLLPFGTIGLTKGGYLSGDGRCKSFDERANGYVRSEGAGMVVLKPLSAAQADGDPIYAVIRGSAVNQDGRTEGMAAPNRDSQIAVLREAYRQAGIKPSQVQYIEAHGTGTQVGDRLELEALGVVLGEARSPADSCLIGSVKTNIGHLEAAAGIAGLIKMALSLKYQQIPASLHFREANRAVDLTQLSLQVQQRLIPWPNRGGTRRAGVNSFGFGGTNAHIVLEEAPRDPDEAKPLVTQDRPRHLLTLSAKSETALKALALSYQTFLESHPLTSIADVCFSANTRRSLFNHRLVLIAQEKEQFAEFLGEFGQKTLSHPNSQAPISNWQYNKLAESPSRHIAFLFTGQGSQLANMGRELYETQPLFKEIINRCADILKDYLDLSLIDLLYPASDELAACIHQTAYTQPALFALEYALAQLWMAWGIVPVVVMGHSLGEYVAACLAGVFSLEDALRLVAQRGKLIQSLPAEGAMVAVLTDAATVRQAIASFPDTLSIAAHNGPQSWVLSGEKIAIASVTTQLNAQGVKTIPLPVSHAFHSPLLQPILAEFRRIASEITYHPPRLTLIANLTGEAIADEMATPEYWCLHLRHTVRFADSVETLQKYGCDVLLEIGAQPVLLGMGQAIWASDALLPTPLWLPSLRSGCSDWQQLLHSLGELYLAGVSIDWASFETGGTSNLPYYPRRFLHLPTYPFQRQRYWWEGYNLLQTSTDVNLLAHPLLGQRLASNSGEGICFQTQISATSPAYLQDHCWDDTPLFPASAYLEMALAAGKQLFPQSAIGLETIQIDRPLFLPLGTTSPLQITLTAESADRYQFQISNPTHKISHVQGKIRLGQPSFRNLMSLLQAQQQCTQPLSVSEHYQQCQKQGLVYGAAFQGIQKLWRGVGQALGWIQLPASLVPEAYQIHPALLDAAWQVLGAILADERTDQTFLPIGIDRFTLIESFSGSLWSYGSLQSRGNTLKANFQFWDEQGQLIGEIQGFTLRAIARQFLSPASEASSLLTDLKKTPTIANSSLSQAAESSQANLFYQVVWQPSKRKTAATVKLSHWLIFADKAGLGVKLAESLRKQGDRTLLVFPAQSYEKLAAGYQLNPTQPADFEQLFQDLQENLFICDGIIHLWGATPEKSINFANLQAAQRLGCGSVIYLIQALSQLPPQKCPHLWLVTRATQAITDHQKSVIAQRHFVIAPQQGSLWGLRQVITLEHPDLACTCLDFEAELALEDEQILLAEVRSPDGEDQIAYRQGNRYVPRLLPAQAASPLNQLIQLKIDQYGSLDRLKLVPLLRCSPAADEVEIQVQAAGVNFRDVLNALGMLQAYLEQMGLTDATAIPFGGECAGTIVARGEAVTDLQVGDEVVAAFALGSLASYVRVKASFVVPKPKFLSFTEAATIPSTFLTAYYGLHYLAKIKAGDRVLIHAAAGGVGQAAVQLAQQVGAEVFATASPPKWDTLKSQGIEHIFNSRTLAFAHEILAQTEGQGVDVVLNSLNGDFMAKSLELLAAGGRFVEIGKIGVWDTEQVRQKRADITYFIFDLLDLAQQQPGLITAMLTQLMQAFTQGRLKPLPATVFPIEESVSAFRYMAGAKHIGKVVISLPSPSVSIRSDATYLITGGWGALGLQVAQWMTQQGAKHLILTGRSEPSSQAAAVINRLEQAGTQVRTVKTDVANPSAVNRLLASQRRKKTEPPLRGIIHAAGVLDDGILLKQSWQRFDAVMQPKVAGTWNLHAATQDCSLDFFVCFSSMVACLGSFGQGNYGAANSFMDTLMHYRRCLGLPGLSINWGPWAETGMASALEEQWKAQGIMPLPPDEGLKILEQLLAQDVTQIGVLLVNWEQFLAKFPHKSPFFGLLKPIAQETEIEPNLFPRQQPKVLQTLASLSPQAQKSQLGEYLQAQIARVLGFNSAESIDSQQDFADYGLDSLMAVEFKNNLQADLGISLTANVAFDYSTIALLTDYLLQEILGKTAEEMPLSPAISEPVLPINFIEEDWTKRVGEERNGKLEILTFLEDLSEIPRHFYQFNLSSEYLALKQDLETAGQIGNPFFMPYTGVANHLIRIGGQELINYASYNYLGLSGSAVVCQAAQAAIASYGTSVSASRVLSGEIPLHRELERAIANFLGTEDCIVYIGGHTTNVTTIGHLFGKNDLIVYDALSHNSIRQGCLLSRAKMIEFPHNDWQTLEQLLQQHRLNYEKVLIAVEGIYSAEGDIAPLPRLIDLKKRYKTFLMVDEAHSIGVLGDSGRGIGEHFGAAPTDVDLWMGTLSKSLASCGGYIAASETLVEYLKYTAPGFVFSVGISPANTAAALAALQQIQAEPQRVKRLRDRAKLFLTLAQNLGLNTGVSQGASIIPIIVGEPRRAVELCNALFEQGINVQPMVYPSVPYDAARLRFFITCDHTEAQIHLTLEKLIGLV